MKKISLVLACLLIFSLASCSGKDQPTEQQTSADTIAPTDAPSVSAPTEAVTDAPSVSTPTEAESEAPSASTPTEAETEAESEAPSASTPTEAVTDAPSASTPTEKPTEKPTDAPTEAFALIFTQKGDAYTVTGHKGTALDVVIPDVYEGLPVTEIGAEAFAGSKTLVKVTCPSSLSVIGEAAFKDCSNLQSVVLPADLLTVSANAFQRCNAITAVTYGGTQEAWKEVTVGIRNQTLTKATFTYLNQPSVHDKQEEIMDPIYTLIEPKTMTLSNGDLFNYRMYVPEDYNAEKAYPVLILLHGAGERGDDNTLQMKNMVATLFADEESPIHDAIFLCPQCPTDRQWVNTPWADGNYSTDDVPVSNQIQGVLEMLASVRASHNVDANRIYIMGISMGGFGTWDILVRNPNLFAAAIPICGGGDASKAAAIAHIPIRTFHGDSDTVVPVDGTRAMVEALRAVGGNIEYEELAGYGHNVWDYAAEKEGLMDWLFAQRKGETDIEVSIGDLMGQ